MHILASRTLVVLITAYRPAQFSLAARSLAGVCGPSSRWKDGRGCRSMVKSSISSVSTLSPKPCHTCGREISPRAKWARNWDSIKFCSDHCKGWKSIVRVVGTDASSGAESRGHLSEDSSDESLLARCVEKKEEEKDDVLILHLDAWIEGTILQLAHAASRNKGKAKDGAIPLQQVSDQMDEDLTGCQMTSLQTKICDRILQQNPQKREMIRRAARRLTILPSSQWSYTRRFGADSQRIILSQDHGRTPLTSLQDISFAKGEIYIQASQSSETRD